jgi:DNA-binding NtrC family response regulator
MSRKWNVGNTETAGAIQELQSPKRTILTIRQVQITSLRGARKGASYELDKGRIRFGKADDNDVVIPDDTVSRHHFEIRRDIRGFLLRDLGSTNGTRLDGAVIREAYLRPGAIVTAGQAKLRFRIHSHAPQLFAHPAPEHGPLAARSELGRKLLSALERVSRLEIPVTLWGEPGTKKESLARWIHEKSEWATGPLQVVDARQPTAISARPGPKGAAELIRRVRGGSLLLVEPWELSPGAQARLGRALQQEAAGEASTRSCPTFRLMAATSRDLSMEARKGRFDAAFAKHLSSAQIWIPPLRERKEDVLPLANRALARERGELQEGPEAAGQPPPFLIDLMRNHSWPGNDAELEEFLAAWQRADRETRGDEAIPIPSFEETRSFGENKRRWIDRFEREYLGWLISRCGGNVSRASREAAMDRKHLNNLLKKHGLKK